MVHVFLPRGSIMFWNGNAITEHARKPLDVSITRIENSKRMADGTLRKYVIADKRKWTTSWDGLPDSQTASVDGKWSVLEIENFYNTIPGAFTLKIMPVGTVTFADTGDLVTSATPHKLYIGDTVQFGTITSTTGIVAGTTYYVKTTPTDSTLTLSATKNGATLVLSTDGSSISMSRVYTVMLTEFGKTIEKRGAHNICNVNVVLEEV